MAITSSFRRERPLLIEELPQGPGPVIGRITEMLSTTAPTPLLRTGEVLVDDDLVFTLAHADGTILDQEVSDGRRILPIAPLEEFGSPALAASEGDLANILDAFADDIVLLPVAYNEEGTLCLLVFGGEDGEASGELRIYSSAAALAADDHGSDKLFIVRHGASLVDFLVRNTALIDRILIDPRPDREEPVSLATSLLADLLIMFSEESEPDEDVLPPVEDEPLSAAPTAYRLNLPSHWARIDLRLTAEARKRRIREIVRMQTKHLSDAGAKLRQEIRAWTERAADEAERNGGSEFSFLLARTKDAAAAISLVSYWHSVPSNGISAFDAMREQLLLETRSDDDLVLVEAHADQMLRWKRTRTGAAELGGAETPLLMIDYWIAIPNDDTRLAHVSFSTPHTFAEDSILALSDAIVLAGSWVLPAPAAPTENDHL